MNRRATEKNRRDERVAVYLTKRSRRMLEERRERMRTSSGRLSLSAVAADLIDEALVGE